MDTKEEGEEKIIDTSTEEKIRIAARKIFQQKGYATTRTRDIAAEAGINLALLNYYFRKKEKLFEIIMFETVSDFWEVFTNVVNDKETTFERKIELFVENYTNLFTEKPDIPLFFLIEMRNNPEDLLKIILRQKLLINSIFIQQFNEKVANGEIKNTNPVNFLVNITALTIFPVILKPFISEFASISEQQFNEIMQERKKLIPEWMGSILDL